jgi:hypothetical protein
MCRTPPVHGSNSSASRVAQKCWEVASLLLGCLKDRVWNVPVIYLTPLQNCCSLLTMNYARNSTFLWGCGTFCMGMWHILPDTCDTVNTLGIQLQFNKAKRYQLPPWVGGCLHITLAGEFSFPVATHAKQPDCVSAHSCTREVPAPASSVPPALWPISLVSVDSLANSSLASCLQLVPNHQSPKSPWRSFL